MLLIPYRHTCTHDFTQTRLHASFHTGTLARIIDRGSRGINFMLGALVFNVAPTLFEVAMVATILTAKCGPEMGLLTLATLAGKHLCVPGGPCIV